MYIVTSQYFCRSCNWEKWIPISKKQYGHTVVMTPRINNQEIPDPKANYIISLMPRMRKYYEGSVESGFFFNADHLDVQGLWNKAIFNNPIANSGKLIRFFEPSIQASELVKKFQHHTKFPQGSIAHKDWDGVVLPAQKSWDASVTSVGSQSDYWKFVEKAAKHYGKSLFVKLHPKFRGMTHVEEMHRRIAEPHGATVGWADVSIIDKADHVIVYTSTFAVDAMLRRKPVIQYAPGYFHATTAVTFGAGEIPQKLWDNTVERGTQLVNFLMWRYCFNRKMPPERIAALIHAFAINSSQPFPLPEELSYARNYQYTQGEEMTFRLWRVKPRYSVKIGNDTFRSNEVFAATEKQLGPNLNMVVREKFLEPMLNLPIAKMDLPR